MLLYDMVKAYFAIDEMPVILADNVVKYFQEWSLSHEKEFLKNIFKCLKPPFYPSFWIESGVEVSDCGLHAPWLERFGIMVQCQPDERILLVTIYGKPYGTNRFGPAGSILIGLDDEYYFESTKGINLDADLLKQMKNRGADSETETLRGMLENIYVYPLLLAICFMHCKNVISTENIQSRADRRRAEKEHRAPLTKFYTLNISPVSSSPASNGSTTQSTDPKVSLHICRGHFSTYTQDKPLFGRLVGTFWIPQHMKGSAEVGEIKKNYSVKV